MSNEIFNQMLSAYDLATHQQKRNATFEVNQQIILAGLYNGGFFNEAAFYGGPAYASSMACSDSLIKSKILSEVASMMHGQIIENQINF